MIKHLPILLIAVPLLSALIIPLAGRINRALSWYIATITTGICFVISLLLLPIVLEEGKISYWLGGWVPPVGIEYVIDYLNIFVVLIVAFIAFMVSIYSRKSVEHEIDPGKVSIFYAVYLLFITGLMGIVVTGDIFNLYVFLEITSIAGYALIALGKKREALVASFKYVVMGTIGATFILLGIGYLYLMTGTLNMADLAQRLPELYHTSAVLTAFALLAVGLCLKIALFPLHTWLPNAYAYAPSVVSAAMAATATKVGAYALIRILFSVFEPGFMTGGDLNLAHIFLVFSVIAILAGSILAVSQTDIKKMLAYSSVGQIGYIVLGISLLSVTGLIGSLVHILNHALMKGGLFLVAGAVVYKAGVTHIDGFKGLGKKMPVSMAAFTIGALSMIGVPLTVGFVSKWYLAVASLEVGMWYLVPVILISSLLTAVYFWRVIDNIYFKTAEEDPGHGHHGEERVKPDDAPAWMLAPTVAVAALCIIFGILAYAPVSLAEKAAVILLR
jgi:multicomponent Na+:H+ antiporter subunit D